MILIQPVSLLINLLMDERSVDLAHPCTLRSTVMHYEDYNKYVGQIVVPGDEIKRVMLAHDLSALPS